MTITTHPDALSFERALDENPADMGLRLVYADWLEEREREVECEKCKGGRWWGTIKCPYCDTSGHVSNGFALRAAFMRWMAAEGKYPYKLEDCKHFVPWVWQPKINYSVSSIAHYFIDKGLFDLLEKGCGRDDTEGNYYELSYYRTRQRAEYALFEAWRKWRAKA